MLSMILLRITMMSIDDFDDENDAVWDEVLEKDCKSMMNHD